MPFLCSIVTPINNMQKHRPRPSNSGGSPACLQVPNFKSCTESENLGGYTVHCLPQAKLEDCPSSSWKQLTETLPESGHYVPSLCARAVPNFESCTASEILRGSDVLCLPMSKPKDCQLLSWKQLTESTNLRGCAPTRYDLTDGLWW